MPKKKPIGTQKPKKNFPVVLAVFHPCKDEMICAMPPHGQERVRASLLAQLWLGGSLSGLQGMSKEEVDELIWEKTYRDQMTGDDSSVFYYVCSRCCADILIGVMGNSHASAVVGTVIGAILVGNDIVLFDRNLSRDKLHPTTATFHFTTLEDFREKYWQALQDGS